MLKAQYTALWGALQSLGQIIGMLSLNSVSDRIGRKQTLYVLWVMLAAVSFQSDEIPESTETLTFHLVYCYRNRRS